MVVIALGALFVISPLTRGLGVTLGTIVGLALVLAGSYRLARELREGG